MADAHFAYLSGLRLGCASLLMHPDLRADRHFAGLSGLHVGFVPLRLHALPAERHFA